jgi:hypothetical protein
MLERYLSFVSLPCLPALLAFVVSTGDTGSDPQATT